VDTKRNVTIEAARQLIERFCGGSVKELLVGLVDNQVIKPNELRNWQKRSRRVRRRNHDMIQFLGEWIVRSSFLILTGALVLWLLRVKNPSVRLTA